MIFILELQLKNMYVMQRSLRSQQTNNDNKHKWLFSITRHSLYWESPQFSLFVSYHGPLTWPHLPKTYFPISVPNIIYLCHHLIVYVSFKNFCNCFTAIIMLLSFFCACNMPILYYIKSYEYWYLKSTHWKKRCTLKYSYT